MEHAYSKLAAWSVQFFTDVTVTIMHISNMIFRTKTIWKLIKLTFIVVPWILRFNRARQRRATTN